MRQVRWPPLRKVILALQACVLASFFAGTELRAGSQTAATEPAGVPEYMVKSAMLYHFATFTRWPKSSFTFPDTPIRFCVLGEDPFGPDLDSLVNYQIHGRDILTTRLRKVQHAKECHVLFIAESEAKHVQSILQALAGLPVLTIADMDEFARLGGVVHLKIMEESIRFQINTGTAVRDGLSFSSELLMLADIISGETTLDRLGAFSD